MFLDFLNFTDKEVTEFVLGFIWLNLTIFAALKIHSVLTNLPGLEHQAEEEVAFADSDSSPSPCMHS